MSEDQTLETAVEEDAVLEDDESAQTAALEEERDSQTITLKDDERPSGRSDAKDPWHGLNDFDEE